MLHKPTKILHPAVGWSLVVLCPCLVAILVALYAYSRKHNGLFTIIPAQGARDGALHFLWSSGPTLLMTIITGTILGPLALAIFLRRAGEMANYAIHGTFSRIQFAWRNRKWGLVSLAIAVFLGSLWDTAASGLFESKNVFVCYSRRFF
jgi:hypothetical protein